MQVALILCPYYSFCHDRCGLCTDHCYVPLRTDIELTAELAARNNPPPGSPRAPAGLRAARAEAPALHSLEHMCVDSRSGNY